jgi:polyhydroxyalkanoate synthesis regulator phasin
MKDMEAYVGKMQMQLKLFGAKLKEIVAKTDEAGTEENIDHQTRIDDLKAKYQAAQSKLDELMTAGIEKWESLKAGVESVWNELEIVFEQGNAVKLEPNVAEMEPNVAKMEAQLKAWSTQLDGLVAGYSKSGAQSHDAYHLRLDDLRTLHGVVQMKLNEFINPSCDSEPWETFWATIEDDWNALEAGFKELTR